MNTQINHQTTFYTVMKGKITLLVLLILICFCVFNLALGDSKLQNLRGRWKVLNSNAGVSAMHVALLPDGKVIIFDRTDAGPSNISLPGGKCIKRIIKNRTGTECTAHSVEFTPGDRSVRPLTLLTETWCSSGGLSPDGMLIQSGGDFSGKSAVRYYKPGPDQDWSEDVHGLDAPRWYASNQILPNGKFIVVGGRDQFNYEFIPKNSESDRKLYDLPFLETTLYTKMVQNNLYPFTHLAPDGNLFIFANDRAILLDYINNKVLRYYPVMPGNVSRNYFSTGSSVLLPLALQSRNSSTTTPEAQVFICGGAWKDSAFKAMKGEYLPATKSCGRLSITATDPEWQMEEMPLRRVMGDMILLPTGDVLIINGAGNGTAGWGYATEPVLNPVLYNPNLPCQHYNGPNCGSDRFEVLNPTKTPRMYHSTALLLPDGRVLIGGSNTHERYNFTAEYPTDLSLEAFSPPYISPLIPRPRIQWIAQEQLNYQQNFNIGLVLKGQNVSLGMLYVTMVAPTFTTHSFAMNQRVLVLAMNGVYRKSYRSYVVDVQAPNNSALAPPGYYLIFVVHDGVPTAGKWVTIK